MTAAKPGQKGAARSRARLGAVQALYQMDLAETDLSDILAEFGSGKLSEGLDEEETVGGESDFEFFRDLVTGVVKEQRAIDPKINNCLAKTWRIDRLDNILRAILRAGTYELINRSDVPVKVVINEYLDVAHAFFDDEEPKFINGVLDRLARELRAADFVK